MTDRTCGAARTALLDGRPDEAHLAACAACARFAAALAATDACLLRDGRDAAGAALPPALRARIVRRNGSGESQRPRGRMLGFALRAAAVAAVLLAGWTAVPASLEAAEIGPPEFPVGALASLPVPVGLPRFESLADAPNVPEDAPWTGIALAAGTLLVAGLAFARGGFR